MKLLMCMSCVVVLAVVLFSCLVCGEQVTASTGGTAWSYVATSDGVSAGRALAIDLFGDYDVIVAGTTSGNAAHPSCECIMNMLASQNEIRPNIYL